MSAQTLEPALPVTQLSDARLVRIGRTLGALYLVGDVFGVVSMLLLAPLDATRQVSEAIAAHPYAAPAGAVAVLLMGVSLAFMPVVAYPVLAESSPFAARAYALFRSVLELGAYIAVVSCLAMLPVLAGSVDDATLAALVDHGTLTALTAVGFIGAAIVFYATLLRIRLVPRWLPAVGLVATLPYLFGEGMVLFGLAGATDPAVVALLGALALQELALAGWLLVRGLQRPATENRG